MEMELILILMEQSIKGFGKRTNKMEMELKVGQMAPLMKEIINKERSVD